MDELRGCPFCGGQAVYIATSSCSGHIACVGDCRMRTDKYWDTPMTNGATERTKWHDVAAAAWNRRNYK